MKIVEDLTVSYKKSPMKVIAVALLIVLGLIWSWKLTMVLIGLIYLGQKFKKQEESKKDTKKKCPHCQTEIDWLATRCPHCHGKMSVTKSSTKIAAIVIILMLIIAISKIGSSTSSTSNSTPSPEQVASQRRAESEVFAEDVISKLLKAPSTAKFVDVKAYELSNLPDVWAVNGYVDSQNSFGAMIRSQWEVQLDYRDGKGGTIKSVLFDGKKIL